MGAFIFCVIMAALLILACIIGVIALYLALKNWAWKQMDIELPPKAKPAESYWETRGNSVILCYVCHSCNRESGSRYKYCPWCGKKMNNFTKI